MNIVRNRRTHRVLVILLFLLPACTIFSPATPNARSSDTLFPTESPTLFVAGDLGWGNVSGVVTDGVSGAPIAGAIVTCEHSSYTSPSMCNTTTVTDADGFFIFERIFFHDTDRITLRVEVSDYYPQFYEKDFFDQPEFYLNVSMFPTTYTPILMCTPPRCAIGTSEVYFCNGECLGGCGTTCATYTPTPLIMATTTPLSFSCLDCDLGPALEYLCPLASASDEAMKLLASYGEVQRGQVDEYACKYATISQGNWTYVYYVDAATSEVKFVVINPFVLTPSPTSDSNTPTPFTLLPLFTATETPTR